MEAGHGEVTDDGRKDHEHKRDHEHALEEPAGASAAATE